MSQQSKSRTSTGSSWESLMGVGALVAVGVVLWHYRLIAVLILAVVLCVCLALPAARLVRMSPAARRNVPAALWARCRWPFLTRNLGLVCVDKHASDKGQHRVRHPRARFRADEHGFVARVKTPVGVSRQDFEKAADSLANHWRAVRVSVAQPAPGRLIVRSMRADPLLRPLTLADAPAADVSPHRIWLGRDEHGEDRFIDLRNVSGIVVGGVPGGGKSQAVTSWETQLAPSDAVQFANHDGKGGEEFSDLDARAWVSLTEQMGPVLASLETLTGLMYDRLATVREFTGGRKNIWTVGVSAEWPLVFSTFDETQSWFDLPAAKAFGKEAEKDCAQAINLASVLVKKGRSVGFVSVFASQKPTSDSCPSAITSNCALSVAFPLKTLEAAKSVLGADVTNYPLLSPLTLSLPEHAGVAVVSLRDGLAPYTKVRSPLVTEDEVFEVARATAHLRKDPRTLLPVTVPDTPAELVTG